MLSIVIIVSLLILDFTNKCYGNSIPSIQTPSCNNEPCRVNLCELGCAFTEANCELLCCAPKWTDKTTGNDVSVQCIANPVNKASQNISKQKYYHINLLLIVIMVILSFY